MNLKFGDEAHFSAIDGINSTDIPVLVISGTYDEYYRGESRIYSILESQANEKLIIDEAKALKALRQIQEDINNSKPMEEYKKIGNVNNFVGLNFY